MLTARIQPLFRGITSTLFGYLDAPVSIRVDSPGADIESIVVNFTVKTSSWQQEEKTKGSKDSSKHDSKKKAETFLFFAPYHLSEKHRTF